MEITEVRIKLMEDTDDRLQAFCSITFDNCFVVRDLKIIEGANGPFVAMPSRKLTAHCPHCGTKNHLRAAYCNNCGSRLRDDRGGRDQEGRSKLYADVAHPINSRCREMIQQRVIAEYRAERERARQPGYVSHYDDDYEQAETEERPASPPPSQAGPPAARSPQVRPPDATPPPPHTTPNRQPTSSPRPQKNNDDFGAGIF